jgi:hypothetical protein
MCQPCLLSLSPKCRVGSEDFIETSQAMVRQGVKRSDPVHSPMWSSCITSALGDVAVLNVRTTAWTPTANHPPRPLRATGQILTFCHGCLGCRQATPVISHTHPADGQLSGVLSAHHPQPIPGCGHSEPLKVQFAPCGVNASCLQPSSPAIQPLLGSEASQHCFLP